MFTRIVVGVDCCEGGRDALTLAMQLQSAGGGELVAVHACAPGPLLRGDVLTRVEAQMARVGATGRAQAVADRSPAHTLRMAAEREGAELMASGPPTSPAPNASWPATTPPDAARRAGRGRRRRRPTRIRAHARHAATHRRRPRRLGEVKRRAGARVPPRPSDGRPGPRHHGRARADGAVAEAGPGPRVVRS